MKNLVYEKIYEPNHQHKLTNFLFLFFAFHLILSIKLLLRASISIAPNPIP